MWLAASYHPDLSYFSGGTFPDPSSLILFMAFRVLTSIEKYLLSLFTSISPAALPEREPGSVSPAPTLGSEAQ